MTVLVTGAAGHVGLTLIPKLLEMGRTVRAVDRQTNPTLQALPVEFVQADIRDIASLERAFDGVETVYHMAAYISIQMYEWPTLEAVNVKGVQNIVTLCQKYKVRRLVHFSSIEALDVNPKDRPIDETNALVPPDFKIPYPRSKAEGQRIVLKAVAEGLDAVIVYPTGIIGPNDYGCRASNQILLSTAQGKIPAIPNLSFDFVDVRNVAGGAIAAEQKGVRGEGYMLSNRQFAFPELLGKVATLVGVKPPRTVSPAIIKLITPIMERVARLRGVESVLTRASIFPLFNSHEVSHAKATRELGYTPLPIDQTLADTVAWFRKIGRIPA